MDKDHTQFLNWASSQLVLLTPPFRRGLIWAPRSFLRGGNFSAYHRCHSLAHPNQILRLGFIDNRIRFSGRVQMKRKHATRITKPRLCFYRDCSVPHFFFLTLATLAHSSCVKPRFDKIDAFWEVWPTHLKKEKRGYKEKLG